MVKMAVAGAGQLGSGALNVPRKVYEPVDDFRPSTLMM
jgi:hypothetical protein